MWRLATRWRSNPGFNVNSSNSWRAGTATGGQCLLLNIRTHNNLRKQGQGYKKETVVVAASCIFVLILSVRKVESGDSRVLKDEAEHVI